MKTKLKSSVFFILSTIAIIIFAFVGINGVTIGGIEFKSFGKAITQGLDLQGGVSVVMEIQDEDVTNEDLQKTKQQLELRVNKIGVAETSVTTEGDRRIRVEIPGHYDSQEIVDSLSQTGELTFKSPDGEVLLTGSDVEKASAASDPESGSPVVSLELNSEGQPKFADATQKYLGQKISIYMDDEELSSPTVQSVISNGKATISGSTSVEEAKKLAGLINAGALPVTLKAASVQTVGSQLGAAALPNAIKAGILGIALVFLFMILVYRIPGLIASIALTLYIVLVLFVFGEVGITLTLPGIAALLLTIGMAVDANVLIFERMREELRKGVSVATSVKKGFENAYSSIVDSNVTTIIAALVLYLFGSGSVKGFAVTFIIGIVVSLFTALVVTKFLMNKAVGMGLLSKVSHICSIKKKDIKTVKIVEKKKIWFSVSIIIIALGVFSMAYKGLNIGIDFKGGSKVVLELGEDFNKEEVDEVVKEHVGDAVTNTVDETQYQIKSTELDTETLSSLIDDLKDKYSLEDDILVSQDEIGASIGKDLTEKSLTALGIAFVAMLIYIAIRFEFKSGLVALAALMHDVLITLSVYAIFNLTINSPFIAAILTIVGYSINATIVIFDRIRENGKKSRRKSTSEIANLSVNQTMKRSINTTLTTLFTIVSVYAFVPSVREFAFPIIIGIISGGYSSVLIAPSLWDVIKGKKTKKNVKEATV